MMGKRGVRLLALLSALLLLSAAATAAAAEAPETAEAPNGPEELSLTEQERAFADSCGPLRVGFVQDRVPVSFSDENGAFAGISRYILDRVERLSGLTFEYVPLPAGAITYDYLLEQELDLVTSVEYNEENKRANGILISTPYLSSRKVVVAHSGLNFDYQAASKAALSSGSQTIRKVLGRIFPNFELVDYESIAACFDAVNAGEADLTIQNQYVVEYWMNKPVYEQLKVIPMMGLDDQLCFSAVVAFDGGEGADPEEGQTLISILDKAIAALTEDEVSDCVIRGVLENQYSFGLGDFLYRYRYAAAALGLSALVIVALAGLLIRQRIRSMEDRADAKARGEFLSTMSHELRTPLNGLMGLNYLMGQSLDDPHRMSGYVRQSSATAKYLLGLVSDMLDMSMLQDGRLKLEEKPVDLELLTDTVGAIARSGMAEKDIQFQAQIYLGQRWVTGDELRIQQVLFNLLDNARKFTLPGGHVTLRVEQSVSENGTVTTAACVTDDGQGMSEQFQKHIFDSFARELDTVSKGNQGAGLGLPISRRLAEMMGGELTFTSQKGEGSQFTFSFPAQPTAAPQSEPQTPPVKAGGGRVLIAEDNELNGEIMMELLQGEGFETVWVENGRQALESFSAAPAGFFSAVLMDLLMPEMDGFQAAAAIRALERPDAGSVRIIACTANASEQDRDRARASGMDGFVTKPVDMDELMRALSGL